MCNYTANPQGSQNAEICFKWSDLSPDEKKSSEAPDKFRCVVRTSDENDSFVRTPALLTLKFCGVIQHWCGNRLATNTEEERTKVFFTKEYFQRKLREMKGHFGKATRKLLGHVWWFHGSILLKITMRTAECLLHHSWKMLKWDFNISVIFWQCPAQFVNAKK